MLDLNNVPPQDDDLGDRPGDTAALNAALAERITELATALFGAPDKRKSSATEWRWTEPSSLSVAVSGDRKGCWYWHARSEGGKPLELIYQHLGSWGTAYQYARDFLGDYALSAPPPRRHTSRALAPSGDAPKAETNRYQGDIALLLSKCVTAAGSPVQDYWNRRGVPMPACADLLYAADAADLAEKIGKPAMIARVRRPDGTPTGGLHRTFLNADGTKTKKMLGTVKGGAVQLAPIGADGVCGLAEGLETSAAAMAIFGIPVWAGLSTGGMVALPLGEIAGLRKIIIFADSGPAGEDAARKVAENADAVGIEWEIVRPIHGDDFAHDLGKKATAADYVAQTTPPAPHVSIRDLTPADLSGIGYQDSLSMLAATSDETEAASVALGIVHRFARRIPVAQSAEEFIAGLASLAPLPPATVAELRARLDWITERRKAGLLGLTSLSSTATARHEHYRVTDLSFTPFDAGVVVVKAPHGMGKTQKIGRPFADLSRANGERFVAVCHRRSLAAELANRLEAEDYRRTESVQSNVLAICVNSVASRHDGYCDTVDNLFIDEVSQVIRHIANGSFDKGTSRIAVFNRFISMIRNARRVIVADADLNDFTLSFLEQCRPGERFTIIESTPRPTGLSVTWDYGQRAAKEAMGDILALLAAGEKVIVATDSLEKARTLAKMIGDNLPDKGVLVIDRDHGGKAQQSFLATPNREAVKYDCVIHSPAVSSGVSIEADHFTIGCGLFFGVVTPSDAVQMLRRARTLRQWHIAFDAKNSGDKADAATIAEGLIKAGEMSGAYCGLTDFDRVKLAVEEWESAGKSDFAFATLALLESYGFTTERLSLSPENLDAVDEAHAAADAKYVADIVNARRIGSDRADALNKQESRTYGQNMALKRHAIRTGLRVGTVTESDVAFWDGGRGFGRVERYEVATGLRTDDDHTEHLTLRRHTRVRSNLYPQILAPLKIDLVTGNGGFTEDDAAEFVALVKRQADLLVAIHIVPSTATGSIGYPVRFAGETLAMMGLDTTSSRPRINGERVRVYSVTPASLDAVLGYAKRRKKAADAIASRPGKASSGPDRVIYYIQELPNVDHLTALDPSLFEPFAVWCDLSPDRLFHVGPPRPSKPVTRITGDDLVEPAAWFQRTTGMVLTIMAAPELNIHRRYHRRGKMLDLNNVEPLAEAA